MNALVVLVLGLDELAVLDVHRPPALVGLVPGLALVNPVAVLLAVSEGTLEGVPVGVGELALAVDLVVAEGPLVDEGVPALRERQLPISLFPALYEIALVEIAVAVT